MQDVLGNALAVWLARLNADAALQTLGVAFEELPEINVDEAQSGEARGYVSIGDEVDDRGVLQFELVTTLLAGGTRADAVKVLLHAVRALVLDVFSNDPELGASVGMGAFAGSRVVADSGGRRVQGARHLIFHLRYPNPVQPTL